MDEMTIVHLADLHLDDPKHDVTAGDGHALVSSIIDREDPGKSIIVDTGDWTGSGDALEVDTVIPVVSRLPEAGFTVLIAPGNHDVGLRGLKLQPSSVREFHRLKDHYATMPEGAEYPYRHDVGDISIIVADTTVVTTDADDTLLSGGHLGGDQIDEIGDLVEEADGTVVLATHHCPSAAADGLDWEKVLGDRDELADRLGEAGGVDVWLTGHLHQAASWSNVYGADRLLGSPMSAKEKTYRRMTWNGDRLESEWIQVG